MRARDNPFAVDRVLAVRYKPQGWTWEALLSRLEHLRYRAAIVGPQGSGKTTLLEDLGPRLLARGFDPVFLRLHDEHRRFDADQLRQIWSAGERTILLLDGAEQLLPPLWWRFRWQCRHAGGLIITSHRPGRLPTLVQTETSADLLDQILSDLGARCPDAGALYARWGGNLRDALRELYDRSAMQHASLGKPFSSR